MYGEMPGERLTDAERARLHLWLRRRGRITVELEAMTPLVEARYFARYRAYRVVRAAPVAFAFLAIGYAWSLWEPVSEIRGTVPGLLLVITFFIAMYATYVAAVRYQRRADQRIGAALRQRAARSSAMDLRALFGGRFVGATVTIYCAGCIVGGAAGSLAANAQDRVLSLVFVIGLLTCAGLGGAVLADVVRRPAIAEDDRSLAADDTMRRDDAYQVILPPVAGLAAMVGLTSISGRLMAAYLGYAAVVTWAAVAWWRASVRTRREAALALRDAPS